MSAAYPYQDVYSQQQQQQLNTLAQHYQQPQYSTQMYHPGVAIAYDYNTYAYQQQLLQHPLQQVPQQQLAAQQANHQQQIGQHGQQQFGQPDQWQNMLQQQGMQLPPIMQQHPWAAGAPIQYPETVLNYAPELPVEQFLAANTGAMANGLSAHAAHPAVEFPHATEPASRAKGRATRKSSRAAAAAGRSALGNSAVNVSNNMPEQYFRRHVALVDPFWASATSDDVGMIAVTHLPPAASASTGAAAAVMHSTLSLNLTSSQLILLKSKTAVLQLVCLQVNDKVPHRCHWPCSAIVTVNGQTIRGLFAAKRTPGAQLKQQQVDNLADISTHAAASTVVRLSYTSNSNGYVLGARLVRKQCLALVKQMMAPELDLARAVSEIQMKLAGDGDVEVCVNAVSLRCPLTAMRIKTPAHFITAPGLAYFDLDPFLELAQRSGKWQDPHSSALGDVTQVAYEPWLAAILHELEGAGLADSVEEVEVNPDGCWRPKGAVSDTWFSVLLPPSHAELQMAFKGPSGACVKRKRASEEGDEAADSQQRAKQQRSTAGVSGTGANVVQGDRGCVDLTFDSDEGDEAPAAVKQGSAVNRSSTAAAAGLLSRRGQSVSGAAAASDSKNGTAPAASPRHGHRVPAAQHKQQRSGGEGSQALVSTSRQAGGLPNATTHKPAVQGQQQQQRAGNGRSSAAARTDAPSAVVDVIVIEDSDSD